MKETIIVLVVSVILIFVIKIAFDRKDKKMMENCSYSCAYVTKKYEYGELAKGGKYGAGASLPTIDFVYDVDDKKHFGRCTIPKKTKAVKNGDKYLILISKDDSEKYTVMFKYPIKDSTDFKRYVKEFEQKRKQK